MDTALEQQALTREAATVLAAVVSFGDETLSEGSIYPRLRTIGERAGGLAPRTVSRHLRVLEQQGWVATRHRYRRLANGIRGTSNEYRVDIPECFRRPGRDARPSSPKQQASRPMQPFRRPGPPPGEASGQSSSSRMPRSEAATQEYLAEQRAPGTTTDSREAAVRLGEMRRLLTEAHPHPPP